MIRSEEIDLREGLAYDPKVKGFDSNFWHPDSAANMGFDTAADAIKMGDTGLVGSMSSYSQYLYGDFEFTMRLDTLTGDSKDSEKIIGLLNAGDTLRRGAVFFNANYDTDKDTAVTRQLWAAVVDEQGNQNKKRIPWDTSWDTTRVRFRIRWEDNGVAFSVNDSVVAFLGDKPDSANSVTLINQSIPQSLRISNRSLDTMDTQPMRLQFLNIRNARKVI